MKRKALSLAASFAIALVAAGVGVPAAADRFDRFQPDQRSDQGEARKEMKAGNQLSLREIEKRILPRMKGAEYLGPAYDARAHAYRLKFIKKGRVMYVDVDARTGKIINRSR